MEKLSKNSSDYLQKLNDSLGVVIFAVIIPERVIEYVNCAIGNIFGYKPDECIGKKTEIFYPAVEGYQDFGRSLESAIKEGNDVLRVEGLFKRKNGEIFPCEVTTTFLKENQKIVRGISILQDITERKQTEEELRQYEHIVSCSTDMLAFLNKRFVYLAANQAYLSALKKTSKDLIGHTASEVFGEEFFGKVIKPNAERALAGEEVHYQEWFKFPAYERRYMDIAYYPYFDESNKVVGFVVNGRNITEYERAENLLREKEQQMRLFMLSTNDSIWNWDMVAGTVERSIGFERAFGYKAEEMHQGIEWWSERLHPEDKERIWQTFNDAVVGGKAFCGYEYRFRCRDGSYANIEDSVCIIRDDTGSVVRSLGAMRDITERVRAEELLHEQKKALEQKNIALSEILGQIEIEKKQIKDNVIANAEKLLLPIIQKLRLKGESRKYVQLLRKNLQELTSSFGKKLTEKETRLTSREIEICNMIKNGITSKEIAGLLNISLGTAEKHRNNIRRKLGIVNKDVNLSSILKTF